MSTNELVRSSPEEQGIGSSAILGFLEAASEQIHDLHSIMLLRHGKVVAEGWWEPYERDDRHLLFSLSKSFTSTAVGLAVQEGRLSVDDKVVSFFPTQCPATISENLAAMRVRHLLSMSTGHHQDATDPTVQAEDGDWVRAFLAQPVEHAPGAPFVYNSAATYMLSAIVQKLTGQTLLEYLRPRLLDPLGIAEVTWEKCPHGICTGGWGLSARTEDIARFGQLYLQQGKWDGRQLVPQAWISAATSKQVENGTDPNNDWNQGYGYQFWRCRHGAYRGDGAFGQYCIVMPEQDAVMAITGGVNDMGAVLNLIWQHLLPAMGEAALPADVAASARLGQKLSTLAVAGLAGRPHSVTEGRIGGRTWRLAPNDQRIESLRFERAGDGWRVTMKDGAGEQVIEFGHGQWLKGQARFRGHELHPAAAPLPVACSYAWTTDDTWTGHLRFYRTPASQIWTCRFEGDHVTLTIRQEHAFGPGEWPALVGQLEK